MSTKFTLASLGALALAALGGMIGCPGTLDDIDSYRTDGGTQPVTCTDAPAVVFTPSCAKTGCHNKADAPSSGGLDLESPDIVGRLKDVMGKGGAGKLIDSAAPDKSLLYTKMKGPAPFGARMPLGEPQMPADKLDCVLNWIKKEAGGPGPTDSGTTDTGTGAMDSGAGDAATGG
jgi:hypothetical protein